MHLVNTVILTFFRNRLSLVEKLKNKATDNQRKWFFTLLHSLKKVKYGRDIGVDKVSDFNSFRQIVPVRLYDEIKEWIDKSLSGESDVLWTGKVKWFAKSSGTTADRSKYIPVTAESLRFCHYRGGKDLYTFYIKNYPSTKIFYGSGIGVGGSFYSTIDKHVQIGDLSAILMKNLPFWAQWYRKPDLSIALMSDWEKKIEIIANYIVKENITHISGVPSWTLLLLEKVLEKANVSGIDLIWPNFEVYFHGGVNFDPYIQRFYGLFAHKKPNLMETYNASEGFFAIEDEPGTRQLLLLTNHGVFYEFVEVDKFNDYYPFPPSKFLWEVQKGINYAIIITTNGGLWRYVIGDTVEFTSLNPYRIRITGRTKHFINIAGEEIIVDNVERSINYACQVTGATINEYTVCPWIVGNELRHHWIVEFISQPNDINKFLNILDEFLQKINSDYEAKRTKDLVLKKPIITVVRHNTFYDWMKQKGKLGGQHKVPRILESEQVAQQIIKISEE